MIGKDVLEMRGISSLFSFLMHLLTFLLVAPAMGHVGARLGSPPEAPEPPGGGGGGVGAARRLGAATAPPLDGEIRYPTLADVDARLTVLARSHPNLVERWSAQQKWTLSSPGQCGNVPCRHYFVAITNRTSAGERWSAQSPARAERPQVFFSGNLHGDEWVGPVTLLTLAELLVAAAEPSSPAFNPWLSRLVNTRVVVLLVVSNPLGYHHMDRLENGVDPNRDFPFEQPDCMRSVTARAINECWRESLFQLAVTFHGGQHSITYEWGAPSYDPKEPGGVAAVSPDDVAQAALSATMAAAAGPFSSENWLVGRTNDVVYSVKGGMEDWAYAGA
jgi:hypothetical protein